MKLTEKDVNVVAVTQDGEMVLKIDLSEAARTALTDRVREECGSIEDALIETQVEEMVLDALVKGLNKKPGRGQLALLAGGLPAKPEKSELVACLGAAWSAKVGVPSYPRLGKAIKPIREAGEDEATILKTFVDYLENSDPKYCSPENFASRYTALREGTFGRGEKTKSEWSSVIDDLIGGDA